MQGTLDGALADHRQVVEAALKEQQAALEGGLSANRNALDQVRVGWRVGQGVWRSSRQRWNEGSLPTGMRWIRLAGSGGPLCSL